MVGAELDPQGLRMRTSGYRVFHKVTFMLERSSLFCPDKLKSPGESHLHTGAVIGMLKVLN